ncbi:unnamed protein product, partial [Ranitomeya imitator]
VDFPDLDLAFRRPLPADSPCAVSGESPALRSLAHRCSAVGDGQENSVVLPSEPPQAPRLLPLILGSAPGWDPPTIAAMYRVLEDGTFSSPLEALPLLSPSFADGQVRAAACRELERLSCDELMDILPQLVQAVKFEWRLDSALVRLLLQRCLQSIQLAHNLKQGQGGILYVWRKKGLSIITDVDSLLLLTDAASEPHYRGWYQRLLSAVHHCVGRAVSDQLSTQKRLMGILGDVAETVRNSPEEKRQGFKLQEANLHIPGAFWEKRSLPKLEDRWVQPGPAASKASPNQGFKLQEANLHIPGAFWEKRSLPKLEDRWVQPGPAASKASPNQGFKLQEANLHIPGAFWEKRSLPKLEDRWVQPGPAASKASPNQGFKLQEANLHIPGAFWEKRSLPKLEDRWVQPGPAASKASPNQGFKLQEANLHIPGAFWEKRSLPKLEDRWVQPGPAASKASPNQGFKLHYCKRAWLSRLHKKENTQQVSRI